MKKKTSVIQKTPVWVTAGLICTILWGSAPTGIKSAYTALSVGSSDIPSMLLFAGIRFSLGGLLTLAYIVFKTKRPPVLVRPLWLKVILLGLMQTTVHYAFYFVGAANTSGTNMAILSSMQSFMLVIIAHFVDPNDRLTKKKLVAIALGVSGIVLLNMGKTSDGASLTGDALILLAALTGTCATFLIRAIVRRTDPFLLTGWQLLIGGLTLILTGLSFGGTLDFTVAGTLLILYLALISAVAFSLWSLLLEYHPITRVGIFNSLIPVFGTLIAGIFLAEDIFSPQTILAMVLVSLGVYIVSSSRAKHAEQPHPEGNGDKTDKGDGGERTGGA